MRFVPLLALALLLGCAQRQAANITLSVRANIADWSGGVDPKTLEQYRQDHDRWMNNGFPWVLFAPEPKAPASVNGHNAQALSILAVPDAGPKQRVKIRWGELTVVSVPAGTRFVLYVTDGVGKYAIYDGSLRYSSSATLDLGPGTSFTILSTDVGAAPN